jgi:2-alkyl-3-oxoalkanoate reductase
MRVFIAGATGAVGRELVPALISAGHAVTYASRLSGSPLNQASMPSTIWV